MNIGLQVSLTETFNIVAADFVSQGIPIIVSEQIDWMPSVYKVRNVNSSCAIQQKINAIWRDKFFGLHKISKLFLWWHNWKAKRAWLKFLKSDK